MNRTRHDLRSPKSSHYHGIWMRLKAGSYTLALMVGIYLCTVYVAVGWITYLLSLFPCVIIVIAALARVNDLGVEMKSTRWNVRRNGLLLTALYAISQLTAPLAGAIEDWPTWRTVIGLWGFALVWLTSEHLPPFNVYIWQGLERRLNEHPMRRKEDDFDAYP